MSVRDVVDAERRRWGGTVVVDELVHGTDDPATVAEQVERWCREVLRREVTEGLFHTVSAGSVTGVVLDDGSRVVVKAYQPQWSATFLGAVVEAQRALAGAGLPCPEPLAGPTAIGDGLATADGYLTDPGQPPSFGRAEMLASVRCLERLVATAPWVEGLREHPMRPSDEGGLYPRPHSPLFDFEATAAGAEWIDELAMRAGGGLGVGPEVVGHMDWSARNVRLARDRVRAIYDMDSLSIAPVSMVIAGAAATWRSTAEPGDAAAPGIDEVDAFVAAWPTPLDPSVRASVYASVVYQLAYTSRCEHAVDPDARAHQRARPTLRPRRRRPARAGRPGRLTDEPGRQAVWEVQTRPSHHRWGACCQGSGYQPAGGRPPPGPG